MPAFALGGQRIVFHTFQCKEKHYRQAETIELHGGDQRWNEEQRNQHEDCWSNGDSTFFVQEQEEHAAALLRDFSSLQHAWYLSSLIF